MARDLVCIHVEEGELSRPYELKVEDLRANAVIAIHNQADGSTGFFEELLDVEINRQQISLAIPNEIALALNNAWRAFSAAKALRPALLTTLKASKIVHGASVTQFYDYLELIQTALVFNYKALEAFCNAVTPDNFVHEKRDGRGVLQRYDKPAIERWLKTTEKITEILPAVLQCPSPKDQPFWSSFIDLERLRNEIIHSKSMTSSSVLAELFSPRIDRLLQSAVSLLKYFHSHSPDNAAFPLEFGTSKIRAISIPDFDSYLEQVPEA